VTPDISLDQARALIERAIDKAEQLGLRGSLAVVGGSGALVSASRTFQCPSAELAADGLAAQLGALVPFPVLAAHGGLPVEEDGRVVAGLGVAGRDPGACEEIAAAVLAARHGG
jgi:uncharacterized protein GlcG (DUF336 family)